MITPFTIRCFKNSSRISPASLTGLDARLLHMELTKLLKAYETRYGESLSKDSILICVDEKEMYRSRERMKEYEIWTVDDILHYLEIDNVIYVIKNNELVTRMDDTIVDAYVLEIHTKDGILSTKKISKIKEAEYGS